MDYEGKSDKQSECVLVTRTKKRKYGNEYSIADPESWKFQRGGICMGSLPANRSSESLCWLKQSAMLCRRNVGKRFRRKIMGALRKGRGTISVQGDVVDCLCAEKGKVRRMEADGEDT